MVFFVGWHYVKQGYGMLMVDAALKRSGIFQDPTRRRCSSSTAYLRLGLSRGSSVNPRSASTAIWGLSYYSFAFPTPLLVRRGRSRRSPPALMTLWMLVTRWQANGGACPRTASLAYLVSLYLWILFVQVVRSGARRPGAALVAVSRRGLAATS